MPADVHILATVRKLELLPATTLVFDSIRTAFPENPITVYGNALTTAAWDAVQEKCRTVGAHLFNGPCISHDEWLETLVLRAMSPFYVCDTDVVFWHRMPGDPAATLFSGQLEPEFHEEWTRTLHVERLHTSVMSVNPTRLRPALRAWMGRIPLPWGGTGQMALIRQHFIPRRDGETLFYDTMAGAWQAGLGTPFDAEQCAAFDHLHCGTYSDLVDAPSLAGLRAMHRQVFDDPARAKGLRAAQQQYYNTRKEGQSHAV